ncbi:MAG: preprotein translocase subunit SecA [Cryomorphaceae bacterium]|nr:MAG: preprotein translocase subunit SecA [Cryomorphaceae bacterium]
MIDSITKIVKAVFGDKSTRDLKEISPLVHATLTEYDKLQSLSNDELRARSAEMKKKIAHEISDEEAEIAALKDKIEQNPLMIPQEKEAIYDEIDRIEKKIDEEIERVLLEILPEAFALVRETARRFKENEALEVSATEFDRNLAAHKDHILIEGEKATWKSTWMAAGSPIRWDMVHYEVQLIGGVALHKGKIAEMQTGEGKTLVATLPVFLNALAGKGVHLVTVNDYLARRDSEWMGPIYEFHGLSVDCIDKHQPNSDDRRNAYRCDIVFGTNNEFGFDYLRDNMSSTTEGLVQRKHHYAIVDEVDSVLIDDARTPLIISGPTPRGDIHEFDQLKPKVEKLVQEQRKLITQLLTEAKKTLTNENATKEERTAADLALFRSYRGLPKNKAIIKFLSEPGIKQRMLKTEAFYMQDQSKEMHKADEILYFTIDEKNNTIDLTEKGVDLISTNIEDSDFFLMPDIGSEIARIENETTDADERIKLKDKLLQDFSVKSERIHTINQLLKAYTLFEKDVEYVVMNNKVMIVDEQTGRIMEGRRYSDGLHQAIESKENVKVEAATQTYATITLQNYFRMYHKLAGMTGTAETEAGEFWDIYKLDVVIIPTNRPVQRADMEDKVYKTAREKYNAAIEEIVALSKAGRPVLVGTTSVDVSELLSRMLKLRGIEHSVLNAKKHQQEADIVARAGQAGVVTIATNMAGRGTDIKLGQGVKEAGGLAIVGTEKHESRRVDRQLRGRSGRQGDPGSSQFYLSLEDNLMRLFGSDRIAKMMDRLGLKEGEVIQHRMITRSIERAQRKVEENNFGIRKRLLEYDDVMNAQRTVIYKRRRHALHGDRLSYDIENMFFEVVDEVVNFHQSAKDFEGFKLEMLRQFGMESPFDEETLLSGQPAELTMELFKKVREHYIEKSKWLGQKAMPIIRNVHETQTQYSNIMVPFTDGVKALQVISNIEKTIQTEGEELIRAVERNVTLGIIDEEWKNHLRAMDELRTSVQNAVYEQKDPLLIYKFESFELFKTMVQRLNREVVAFLSKCTLATGQPDQAVQTTQAPKRDDMSGLQTSRPGGASSATGNQQQTPGMPQERPKPQPVRTEQKIGRNDPCPCGSGKKYKQCHGKTQNVSA